MASAAPSSVCDLPIPRDVAPGPGWSAQMIEMAGHIGAYETLLISDHFGGQQVYIPADAGKNPFLPLIGMAKAKALSWAYRRETLSIPTAKPALARARRASVIASVRAGDITVSELARRLRIRRDYASRLVNQTDEGRDAAPLPSRTRHDPR